MSDPLNTAANGAEPTNGAPAADQRDAAQRLWNLLDTLVPNGTQTIHDARGVPYVVTTTLPARRQVPVLRALKAALDTQIGDEDVAGVRAAFASGNVAAGIGAMIELLDDRRLAILDQAFASAFPEVLKQAATGTDSAQATDLFPLEEVVRAVLPFGIRLVRQLGGAITSAFQ